jgi:hypothetical protein
MMAEDIFAFSERMHDQGIVLCYNGYFSEKVLTGLGDALKAKMAIDETDASVSKRVFSVFVEQTQNIIRYSADKVPLFGGDALELRYGTITIGHENGRFFIIAGNRVEAGDVPRLQARLLRLQTMSKDELRRYYKERLRAADTDSQKGAGLGFIEIARIASEPFTFDFKSIDAEHCFFCLKAYI